MIRIDLIAYTETEGEPNTAYSQLTKREIYGVKSLIEDANVEILKRDRLIKKMAGFKVSGSPREDFIQLRDLAIEFLHENNY